MKFFKLTLVIFSMIAFSNCSKQIVNHKDYAALVNPFVGTVGSGNTFLGAVKPYGMVQLGPWLNYSDNGKAGTVYGFSHTHVSGKAGGGNEPRGSVVFMPVVDSEKNEFQSDFQHSNETASPDSYKVFLDDSGITAELTATTRTGFHKYTFPESDKSAIVLKVKDGSISIIDNEISGSDNGVFFIAKFSKPFENYMISENDSLIKNKQTVKGENLKVIFNYQTKNDDEILLKVGISIVSIEGARNNLETELSTWDFNATRKNLRNSWNKELSKIEVEGGTETEQIIFYTALYHSLLHPNIFMDLDGKYSSEGKVYTATDFDNYTNFSLWDTFRALHPLFTIIDTERTSQFIRTFLARYDNTGRMLIMDFEGVEGTTPPMIAYHSLSVLADAYVKNIRDYDVEKAYKAMKHLADDKDRLGKQLYLDYGFIPSDLKGQTVSRALEYSYDDWCVTRLAKDFNDDDLLYYSQRADFYKNLFSSEYNFMLGKKSNFQFIDDFDPMETTGHYTEANAYQYSTFVPQDIEGLINLMGGDKVFENWLDTCFATQTDYTKINVRDVTGLIGQYAHGNEPSHSIAYQYNYVGTPWKTQKLVRQILTDLYQNSQGGIDGNEDCGQMSAWYVMSAMGIYSVTPGLDYYVIGSPVFDNIVINLEDGKTFEISALNNSSENVYIQSVKLNGKNYTKSYIKHQDIMNGGKLEFQMGNKPNKNWGKNKEDRPYAASKKFKYATAPTFDFDNIMFLNSTTVTLSNNEFGTQTYYTTDGSEPTNKSTLYTKAIKITKPTTLKAKSFVSGIKPSYITTVHFKRIEMLESVKASGLKPGIKYDYREPSDIMSAKAQEVFPILDTGILKTFHVDAIKDSREFGYVLEGYLKVPKTGVYTFYLEANDGAVLYLNDKLIIDNDGSHREQRLDSKIGLKKGWHPIDLKYFQLGLAKNLIVIWEGPGMGKQEIKSSYLFHKN